VAVVAEREARGSEARFDLVGRRLAGVPPGQLDQVGAQPRQLLHRLVALVGPALLDGPVTRDGDAHQPHDHVREVAGLLGRLRVRRPRELVEAVANAVVLVTVRNVRRADDGAPADVP
jgi:hypothetical protein